MAENERLGASFQIDVTNLKAGLSTANKLIRESESEFKAAAAGMDDWTKSGDGLNAKIKSLNDITDIQRKKVDALQKEYDNLINDGLDPTSNAAVDLRTKINKEKEALAKNESELKKQQKALEELGDEADDAADAVEETGDAAKKSGDGFTVAKGAISGFIANGLSALVGACKNAITSIAGLAEQTREYREDMGKLETAFEAAGKSTKLATKTYKGFYSVLGEEDRSVEAVNHLAKFVETEKDMNKWTDICAGVWGTFGDSLPIEGLTEASNETAKTGEVTGVLADALNWAGLSQDDFQASLDKCSTEQERSELITNTLNELYGEAAEKYKENNKSVIDARNATSDYNDKLAELGAKVEPITTKIREGFTKILDKVLELVEGVDLDAFGEKIDNAFDTFIDDYLPKIIDGLTWIKDHGAEIAAVVTGIGAAMATMAVANKIKAVVDAFKAYKVATEGATVAQWALNVAQNANPIGLIIAAIVGLVAAFVILWNKCEGFRNFWKGLWDGIKKVAKAVGDWFVETWGSISKWFSEMWVKVKNGAKNAWEGIKSVFSKVGSFFQTTFSKAWEKVKAVFSTGGKVFDGIKEGIITAFKAVVNALIRGINKVVAVPFRGLNNILDRLNNISIAGLNPFSWLTWRATIPQLPQLAEGGVIKRATTVVAGEDGDEAIVPLEKNTEWIDKVADRVAEKQPKSVVVNQTNNYSQAHSRYEIYKSKQQTAAAVRLALAGVK